MSLSAIGLPSGAERQLQGAGWQYVLFQAATVGQMLIELKEVTPHGEFMANYRRVGILGRDQAQNLMTLARHLPLLEQHRPDSQRVHSPCSKPQRSARC